MNRNLKVISKELGDALRRHSLRLSIAESCTGGGLSEVITAIPGSEQWFDRGVIAYSNRAMHELLKVPLDLLYEHGPVSVEVARLMAEGALSKSLDEISIAITGFPGPCGGSSDKPVGTMCFAWASPMQKTSTTHQKFSGDRDSVRTQATYFALQRCLALVNERTKVVGD